jgi:DNA polymerase
MPSTEQIAAKAALEFYIDHGVDVAVGDEVIDRTVIPDLPSIQENVIPQSLSQSVAAAEMPASGAPLLGKTDAHAKALELAAEAQNLDDLKQAIADFDGISLKKTATNMVFADGNPESKVMVIGEAPGADEDRQGKPFVGVSGQLLDKILACIGLDRNEEDPLKSVYLSNVLNWRPPGNRTPAPAEIEVSLPFIERHIQLVQPEIIILCGGVSAKGLLASGDSISRLRKTWHNYLPQNEKVGKEPKEIPAIATYHPSYLLKTPAQKKAVWADMLMLNEKRKALNLLP